MAGEEVDFADDAPSFPATSLFPLTRLSLLKLRGSCSLDSADLLMDGFFETVAFFFVFFSASFVACAVLYTSGGPMLPGILGSS